MMQFTELFKHLKEDFNQSTNGAAIGDSGVRVYHYTFHSAAHQYLEGFKASTSLEKKLFGTHRDSEIHENNTFSYPVVVPPDVQEDKAILLLHGLNERSWDKYLPWAYRLALQTHKAVVLFPISFHMNRSPVAWNNPRQMMTLSKARGQMYPQLQKSSYLNVAISERLTNAPQRLMHAGYQSALDVIHLLETMQAGRHPHFKQATQVDFLSYSIGAFLTEILMLANPRGMMDNSRIMLFCGGTELSQMNGASKFIMDSLAFERIHHYYNHELETDSKRNPLMQKILRSSKLGEAFIAMLHPEKLRDLKRQVFGKFGDQLQAIALKRDQVIPAAYVAQTLGIASKGPKVQTLDFPYPYSHETPFPVNKPKLATDINQAFDQVFGKIGRFLEDN